MLGVPQEDIDTARARAAEFDEQPAAPTELVVWEDNALPVEVYRHCRWDVTTVSGLGGAIRIADGISCREILAACELLGVPAEARSDVLSCVRIMERAARPVINKHHV